VTIGIHGRSFEQLLALVDDPREMAAGMRKTERGWLRQADPSLDPVGLSGLDPANGRRAEQAYQLLVSEP
jgi:hypothetical protein